MDNLLYIGLNGLAGSGKDTVAKMMYCILNKDWTNKEECWEEFRTKHATHIKPYATLSNNYLDGIKDEKCTCIAFADALKRVCSSIFGVPVEYFYYNKNNSWICINKDFEYTEQRPQDEFIVTAEEYFDCCDSYQNSSNRYYMSLREILVYIGTYVCQEHIIENVFVNSVQNKISNMVWEYPNLNYVICTDVRFTHEYDFVRQHAGIMVNITREGIQQAADIAEHELDYMDEENFNYVIYNDGTYEDLFDNVWDLCNNNLEFKNQIISLRGRTQNASAYLRILDQKEDTVITKLCSPDGISKVTHSEGRIMSIDPQGGPNIYVSSLLLGTNYYIESIIFDDDKVEYIITLVK